MPVAVKFWRPGKAEVGYFCLEQARGHLRSHPCLMRVIAVHGEGAGGCPPPCIVMPRMHLSVQDLLDMRDPLPIDVVVRIVRDTLDGLKVLHSQGLVHNDIKPDNLFIGFTDCARSYLRLPSKEHTRDYCDLVGKRDFQVVIGDLGVAQREGEPAHPFGDDSYKAPEQRPSDPRRPADCRADTKFDIHAALKVLQQLIR
jgi:serine/threonine protein kinase